MRTAVTILILLAYVAMFNFYIYELTRSYHWSKIVYCLCMSGSLLFYHFNRYAECPTISGFNDMIFWAIIANFIITLCIYLDILINPKQMFYTFNGLIFAVTLSISTNMARHGYFNKKYEND